MYRAAAESDGGVVVQQQDKTRQDTASLEGERRCRCCVEAGSAEQLLRVRDVPLKQREQHWIRTDSVRIPLLSLLQDFTAVTVTDITCKSFFTASSR